MNARFPIIWPAGRPRRDKKDRIPAKFTVDFEDAYNDLLDELDRLGAVDVVVSSNVPIRKDGMPTPTADLQGDPGVAVHFNRDGLPYVIACDLYVRVRWNLRAISSTIAALRSIDRHGATGMLTQAISGFAALPPARPALEARASVH